MQLKIFKNVDELSDAVATWVIELIQSTLKNQDRFTIALSGGNTPKKLYQVLASEKFKHQIDWKKIHVFWGDERFVSYQDNRNNAKMAMEELLDHVPIPREQIHRMRTNINSEESAKEYEKTLRKYFPVPTGNEQLAIGKESAFAKASAHTATFDLVLLGLGDNAHTLSLFPGYQIIHEKRAWVLSVFLKEQNMTRITLAAPVVNFSKHIAFLVTGSDKADALVHSIEGHYVPDMYPAQIIEPVNGELFWFVDEAAAARLKKISDE